jgi:hypothetical protein
MSLIETIQELKISPRHQEEEYEYTSDFLEWFYYNVYRQQGFSVHPILSKVVQDPEYQCIEELCRNLINWRYGITLDSETLTKKYENMRQWTIDTINKYNQNE